MISNSNSFLFCDYIVECDVKLRAAKAAKKHLQIKSFEKMPLKVGNSVLLDFDSSILIDPAATLIQQSKKHCSFYSEVLMQIDVF